MKLLFCAYGCSDIFGLGSVKHGPKSCRCGRTTGAYNIDGDTAWHNGKGILLGFRNDGIGKMLLAGPIVSKDAQLKELFVYDESNGKIEIRKENVLANSNRAYIDKSKW